MGSFSASFSQDCAINSKHFLKIVFVCVCECVCVRMMQNHVFSIVYSKALVRKLQGQVRVSKSKTSLCKLLCEIKEQSSRNMIFRNKREPSGGSLLSIVRVLITRPTFASFPPLLPNYRNSLTTKVWLWETWEFLGNIDDLNAFKSLTKLSWEPITKGTFWIRKKKITTICMIGFTLTI